MGKRRRFWNDEDPGGEEGRGGPGRRKCHPLQVTWLPNGWARSEDKLRFRKDADMEGGSNLELIFALLRFRRFGACLQRL